MSSQPAIKVSQVAMNSTLPPEPAAPAVAGGGGDTTVPKRKAREKVALTPGHSHLDWMRLASTDLAGQGGRMRQFTLAEVRAHRREDDCWMVCNGRVYNVTPYMLFHPGGTKELMKGAGKDATKLLRDIHAWVNVESMLRNCLLGVIKPDDDSSDSD